MKEHLHRSIAKVTPRPHIMYCSQGRAVLATDLEGMIGDLPRHGLFYGETRMLSRYRYLVEGNQPGMVAVSNVAQHSWLGYYVFPPPGSYWKEDTGSGQMEQVSEETIELKVSRTVGLGAHEDLDFTNYSLATAKFLFEIELDSDFADQAETVQRKQTGKLQRRWKRTSKRAAQLTYDYRSEHRYSHQGNRGLAKLHRGLIVRIENADSPAAFRDGRLRFTVKLTPGASWHTCIKFIPVFEGEEYPPCMTADSSSAVATNSIASESFFSPKQLTSKPAVTQSSRVLCSLHFCRPKLISLPCVCRTWITAIALGSWPPGFQSTSHCLDATLSPPDDKPRWLPVR